MGNTTKSKRAMVLSTDAKTTVKDKELPSISSKKSFPYDNSPIYDLLQVFERPSEQWTARYVLILGVVLLKAAVGLGPYSGQGEKPINGDFEAQRHWMELTTSLPMDTWYFYDLQYWGLDYPPLTAYHSWILGKMGKIFNPEWFELSRSRGFESTQLKTYMRFTCLLSELIVFFPAVMQVASYLGGKKENMSRLHQIIVIAIIFCQPSLILIDNGHFQYNSVMLGLFLFSVVELMKGNLILASIWFMSSVLFKQMALYYSPFIFIFILSKAFSPQKSLKSTLATLNVGKLIAVGVSVITTTGLIVLPFILYASNYKEAFNLLAQIVKRVFPFDRGLFEDKVANFWCSSNILMKYQSRFTNSQLKNMSLTATLLAIAPPCTMCFWKNLRRPNPPSELVVYGFSATAWAFYLFSFQVHEKTVLVPLIPSTFLLLTSDADMVAIVQWINNIATFSLYPLLKREGLNLQYFTCLALINWLLNGFNFMKPRSLIFPSSGHIFFRIIICLSYLAVTIVHILDYKLVPPPQYPDLWVIANTTMSFTCFLWFYFWLVYKIYLL